MNDLDPISERVTAFGVKRTITDWSKDPLCKVSHQVLQERIRGGMRAENAIIDPLKGKGQSTKYRGVRWHKHAKRWESRIKVNQELRTLGYFETDFEAARVYDAAAKYYFGPDAVLNFGE